MTRRLLESRLTDAEFLVGVVANVERDPSDERLATDMGREPSPFVASQNHCVLWLDLVLPRNEPHDNLGLRKCLLPDEPCRTSVKFSCHNDDSLRLVVVALENHSPDRFSLSDSRGNVASEYEGAIADDSPFLLFLELWIRGMSKGAGDDYRLIVEVPQETGFLHEFLLSDKKLVLVCPVA